MHTCVKRICLVGSSYQFVGAEQGDTAVFVSCSMASRFGPVRIGSL